MVCGWARAAMRAPQHSHTWAEPACTHTHMCMCTMWVSARSPPRQSIRKIARHIFFFFFCLFFFRVFGLCFCFLFRFFSITFCAIVCVWVNAKSHTTHKHTHTLPYIRSHRHNTTRVRECIRVRVLTILPTSACKRTNNRGRRHTPESAKRLTLTYTHTHTHNNYLWAICERSRAARKETRRAPQPHTLISVTSKSNNFSYVSTLVWIGSAPFLRFA